MQLKNKITLFTALLLGGFFLQSCSDEDEKITRTNSNSVSGCFITTEYDIDPEFGDTMITTYEYDNNKIISSTYTGLGNPQITTIEYDGDRAIKVTDMWDIYEFNYNGNNSIPSKIDIKSPTTGTTTGYYDIQSSGQNITLFEEHDITEDDIIVSSTSFEYDSKGNVTKAVIIEEDEFDENALIFEASVYDGKRNPYNSNFIFFFLNDGDPFSIGSENLVSGKLFIEGFPDESLPFAASYEYNDDDYPIRVSSTIPGFLSESTTISYDCK